MDISIHAPVKGATQLGADLVELVAISIHAPVKGATKAARAAGERLLISIHAPVKGATSYASGDIGPYFDFNPRTREGCDNSSRRSRRRRQIFQSTHP